MKRIEGKFERMEANLREMWGEEEEEVVQEEAEDSEGKLDRPRPLSPQIPRIYQQFYCSERPTNAKLLGCLLTHQFWTWDLSASKSAMILFLLIILERMGDYLGGGAVS